MTRCDALDGTASARVRARVAYKRACEQARTATVARELRARVFAALALGRTPRRVGFDVRRIGERAVRAMMARPRSMREAYIAHEVAQWELRKKRRRV